VCSRYAHHRGRHRLRALRRRRARDRRELQEARDRRLLRRPDVSPRHQGLHDPGRVSGGHRHRWTRLSVRRRVQRPQDRPWRARDGERGAEHQRLAVLHRHDRRSALAGRQAHRLRRGHRRDGGRRQDRERAHAGSRSARRADQDRLDRARRL
ncbi:MAG: Peptidyl-prolyl cis-trans isomerase, partial [uncultured Solirubrobacteraceae bacterium]